MEAEAFEILLVRHCSPTLAGIKTGSLFNCGTERREHSEACIRQWNQVLNPRGVALTILRQDKERNLVYVFRPGKLKSDFACVGVREFLAVFHYDCADLDSCLRRLKERLMQRASFPHEIGLFLGYPLCDVRGFIENSGRNCKCCGLWKVYRNECETVRLFEKCEQCTRIYSRCLQKGLSIQRLTVAAKS
jgi:hypothetical protein